MTTESAWTNLHWNALIVVKRLKEARADREELLAQNHAKAELEKKDRERERSTGKVPIARGGSMARRGS